MHQLDQKVGGAHLRNCIFQLGETFTSQNNAISYNSLIFNMCSLLIKRSLGKDNDTLAHPFKAPPPPPPCDYANHPINVVKCFFVIHCSIVGRHMILFYYTY